MKMSSAAVLVALLGSTLLGGCSAFRGQPGPQAPDAPELAATPAPDGLTDAGTPIEKIPFRIGVSSATVERMARQQACSGGQGAGLITTPGPVEVYRMQCDNGKIFMARCELRQCKQMQ